MNAVILFVFILLTIGGCAVDNEDEYAGGYGVEEDAATIAEAEVEEDSAEWQPDSSSENDIRADGICDCDTNNEDGDCDYLYVSSLACEPLGYGGGYYDQYAERNGIELNNDNYDGALWVMCHLDTIFTEHEGYAVADIG